jgi:sialate O-acetylesterase
MINSWRNAWGRADLPFHLVQIANYKARTPEPADSYWAEVREAQRKTAENLPDSGLIVTIDIGEEKSVHPINKQEVGRRLALEIETRVYGKDTVCSGPAFDKATFDGSQATVSFRRGTSLGLTTTDGGKVKGFALAGEDKKFFWADAKVEAANSSTPVLVLSAPQVKHPVALRYAWANNPEINLVNNAGLPAVPFRTDNWPQSESPLPGASAPTIP